MLEELSVKVEALAKQVCSMAYGECLLLTGCKNRDLKQATCLQAYYARLELVGILPERLITHNLPTFRAGATVLQQDTR